MSFDKYGRPDWITFWLSLAYVISQRSIDPSTQHGCVITSKDNVLLSIGYNGPIGGIDDDVVPLTRPEKYSWMIHAEENAILNAAKNGINIKDSICYVTGIPCDKCMRGLLSIKSSKIIYGIRRTKIYPPEILKETKDMLEAVKNCDVIEFTNMDSIIANLDQTILKVKQNVNEQNK